MKARTQQHLRWFLVWSVAFYATALGYVFQALGRNLAAIASIVVVVAALAWCFSTVREYSSTA